MPRPPSLPRPSISSADRAAQVFGLKLAIDNPPVKRQTGHAGRCLKSSPLIPAAATAVV